MIPSTNWADHIHHIRSVSAKLRETGLTVKLKKCQLVISSCTCLGHVVGNGEVRPEEAKVDAVRNYPVPTTKKRVRAFLRLMGYYHKFILAYTDIAASLADWTRKNVPNWVHWSTECDQAFQVLKQALCSQPILQSPHLNCQFMLQTDASDCSLGAVGSHTDDDEVEHPVAYYSQKLLQ